MLPCNHRVKYFATADVTHLYCHIACRLGRRLYTSCRIYLVEMPRIRYYVISMPVSSSRALFREFLSKPLRREHTEAHAVRQPGSFSLYLKLLGEHRRAFMVIFFAACLTELLYLTVPVTTRHIIDGVLLPAS